MNKLLLGGDNDLIIIDLYYQVKKNKHGQRQFRILTEKEVEDMPPLKEGEEPKYEKLETRWRPQTWQTNNELLKNSMSYNKVSGGNELDWSAYQQNVFRYCLQSWNLTDNDGKPIPATLENVGMLPSNIARALIQRYDEALMIDDDEKKE